MVEYSASLKLPNKFCRLAFALSLIGCSAVSPSNVSERAAAQFDANDAVLGGKGADTIETDGSSVVEGGAKGGVAHEGQADDETLPVRLELGELINDGRVLHAAVKLTPQATVPVNAFALRLVGFADGDKVRETVRPLKECLIDSSMDHLRSGESVIAYVPLSVTGLSSYSLELLWGGEAKAALPSKQPSIEVAASTGAVPAPLSSTTGSDSREGLASQVPLTFRNVRFEDPGCARVVGRSLPNCSNNIKVIAEVYNAGSTLLKAAEVGLSLSPVGAVKLDLRSPNQQDAAGRRGQSDAMIRMSPLGLAPGARRVVRLVMPRSVYDAAWSAALDAGAAKDTHPAEIVLEPALSVQSFEMAYAPAVGNPENGR